MGMETMARRQILFTEPDPMTLVEELAGAADYGPWGLALGNLRKHKADRFVASYAVLCLTRTLAQLQLIRPADTIRKIGAEVQDKQGFAKFDACHVVPCDFEINGTAGVHKLLHAPMNGRYLSLHVFGKTNIMHKLVNYTDQRCEEGPTGWGEVLLGGFRAVLQGADPADIYQRQLVPGYLRAAVLARDTLVNNLSAFERGEVGRPHLYNQHGGFYHKRPPDFRLGSKAPDAALVAANKAVVLQVFDEYAGSHLAIAPQQFAEAQRLAEDVMQFEKQWLAAHPEDARP